jgi:hypothetical protein
MRKSAIVRPAFWPRFFVVEFKFLGAFAELRRVTIGVVIPKRMEQICSHLMDFGEI